jgi:hypothetical protein
MFRNLVRCVPILVLASVVMAEEPTDEPASQGDKLISGMSIVGNDEAPKSLVIVPWKSAAFGDTLDISRILDDGPRPVDREVFMRRLSYYEIWARSQ